jgi:uncharacterized protein YecE (DUF72 family)
MDEPGSYTIYVGALGWRHSHWLGDFYPEELPEEWQLSFYNSQYRCVYLPFEHWQDLSVMDARSWLADTQPHFRFILQSSAVETGEQAEFHKALAQRVLMDNEVPTRSRLLWFPAEPDLRLLGREIQLAVDQGVELYLLSREAHLPAMEKVRSLVEVLGY